MPDHASCEVVITSGGAHAMRDCATGEVMHPVVGPLIEAERLYLAPSRLAERLSVPAADALVLLDVGLGAGSNAVAALHLAESLPESARRLAIVSFDHTLAPFELALEPAHAAAFGFTGSAHALARQLLAQQYASGERSNWRLQLGELPAALEREAQACADLVFWDPFSPRANPALWTVNAFRALRRLCRAGATVHTYSGATATRAALLLAGFAVGFGVPAGARQKHTTFAAVSVDDLPQPLDRRWFERLARSSAAWPCDAPADALARIACMPQFQA